MARFLMTMLPGAGHVLPSLPVAAELVARGHDVEHWTGREFAAAVRATGAEFHGIPGRIGPPAGRGRFPVRAAATTMLRAPRALAARAAAADRDTVVVYDAMGVWGERLGGLRSVAFATTAVLTPPLLAGWLGRALPGPAGPVLGALALRTGLAAAATRRLRPLVPRSDLAIVTVPREFQPDPGTLSGAHEFVGPCLGPRSAGPHDDAVLSRLDPDRPLVLVALGSAYTDRPRFHRTCLEAFRGTRWQLLLAVGRGTDPAALGPVPDDAVVVPWVPQLRVLERASAFVSHGGMGSVMEAVHHGVPLVLLPQMFEQAANADRITAAGAGRRLPADPAPWEIREAVEHVATDPAVGSAVARLRAAVHDAGGTRRAADLLEKFAAHGPRP